MVVSMLYHRVLSQGPGLIDGSISLEYINTSITGSKYLNGEYKLIQQLSQVLDQGQTAKQLADECIDACAQMQNLREAIYDHKVRLNSANLAPEQAHETETRGMHYLLRYFYLVVFAEYLLEEIPPGAARLDKTFLLWLAERREITNLTLKANLSFD